MTKEVRRPKSFHALKLEEKIKRLELLNEGLGKLTRHERRKHWDMSLWGIKSECGTSACAAGHGSLYPPLRRLGFRGHWNMGEINFNVSPEHFFGDIAVADVFTSPAIYTVGQARLAIRRLISNLRKGVTTGDWSMDQDLAAEKAEEEQRKAEAAAQKEAG